MRVRRSFALIASIAMTLSVSLLNVPGAQAAAAPSAASAATLAAAAPAADRMPGDVPTKKTPWILDGQVYKVVQIGNTMIAGGLFTQVADPMNGTPYARQNLVAFDATTGLVSQTFNPTVDGAVQQLLPGPTPNTVYVAGDFTKINDKGPNHVQLLDINTGLAVSSFKAPSTSGGIATMELLPNNRLFIGGYFKQIAGTPHGQFATLNATTGALDPFMDLVAAGNHNTGTGAKAPIGPREAGLTPAGDRMVVVGNFRTVGGLARDQIVMIDLTGATAQVSTTWYTTSYTPICSPNAFDSYMRDVEMSPDGSYFVVATTGGPHTGTLCDTAARFETYAVGSTLTPTWTDTSGGDTLWGVEVTQSAVYIGGHNRWMNNPSGSDRAGQGAVARPGLVALDPQTGIPLKWNPGRNPRGEAAYEIYETEAGIWVVSDTDWIGDRRYQRPRLAFFPYSEGYNTASKNSGALPGNIYIGAPLAGSNVLYRVNAGGAAIASLDNGPDWAVDTSAAPSPLHNTGSTPATLSALTAANLVNVPASTPLGIWTQERNDPTSVPEMQWSFPVAAGTSTQVRLYFASRSSSTRRFNVLIDGVAKLSNYDPNVDPGVNRGTMKSFDITSDGTVNIDFAHVTGNPEINAIEIINNSTGSNSNVAAVVSYDGATIGSQGNVDTGTFDWTNVRGAVMVGRTLFYGQTDGMLYRRSFNGETFGDPTAVNPYVDPLWNTVETGSGPAGQTYLGALPTWYTQLSTITGAFYANGRIYYTRSGVNSLFWRWFSPDSGIIGGIENTVTGGNITWTSTRGMFLDGANLYVVNSTNGQLLKIGFVNGAPTGTSTVANTTRDWRGKTLFLASVLPNVAPSAAFTWDCTGISCTFDGTSSTDSDGTVQSYEWTFSDGDEAGGPNPQKDFLETGTYDVTLTVTDDGGLTSTTTHQVPVVKPNVPPTADFSTSCEYLVCDFDATTSTDTDGTLDDYAWDFGDGTTGTGSTVEDHVYENPGTYTVTLVVTDDDDATDDASSTTVVVSEPAPSTVSYVGGAVNQGNVTTPNVTTPTTVSAGDRLVLALSVNASNRVLSDPSGITGWTVLGTTTSGTMQTRVYTKIADAADANKRVQVTLDLAAKYTMTVADYSGVRPGNLVHADFAETVNRTGHPTPAVQAPAGAWVLSYWADKSSATTAFSLPGSVTGRQAICGTGTGRVCSSLADSNAAVPTGQYDGLVGTADATSATATTWSIVLRTVDPNQAPTASFSTSCDWTDCDFDATSSSDPDGDVASYAWDFGDGATATGVSPSHDFLTTGVRDVTLTVTDDEGSTASNTVSVATVRNNAAPTASFTVSCTYLNCTFNANASGDTDGTITSYLWDFGDSHGDTTTSPSATHTYDTGGSNTVTLTVTDNDSATGSTTRVATSVAIRPITFIGSTVNQGNVATPNVVVPAGTAVGDRLIMVLSLNDTTRIVGNPTTVTGWTLVDTAVSGTMQTNVYTKVAQAGDAGKTTRFAMNAAAKYTITMAAYSGDMLAPQFLKASETVTRAGHTTPTTQAEAGDWAVSYWADKSTNTTAYTLPGGITSRGAICGTTAGHICSALADSAAGVPAGTYGPLTATANSASSNATMWTILLRQVDDNDAPTAAFTFTCESSDCDFDAAGSSDSDGDVVSYAWDFGDGATANGVSPSHDFVTSGSRDVTLTVTDDHGTKDTLVRQVSVVHINEAPTAAFTFTCESSDCDFDATGSSDSDGAVVSYAWDFGDGATGNGVSPSHDFLTTGSRNVTLTVTDDQGTSGSVVHQVSVVHINVAPTAAFTFTCDDTDCEFDATGSSDSDGAVASYAWDFGDGATGNGVSPSHDFLTTGSRNVTLTVTDDQGTSGSVAHQVSVVHINVAPTAAFTFTCDDTDCEFDATGSSDSDGAVASYAWDFGDGATAAGVTPSHDFNTSGSRDVTLTVTDDHGTSGSVVHQVSVVHVNVAPTAAFTFACDGADCDFDATSSSDPDGDVASYAWDFGDGATATGVSPSHDYVTFGERDVTLTVTDDEGSTASHTISVATVRNNAAPTASFTVSCTYLNCTFNANASGDTDGTITSYQWDFGDSHGETTTSPSATHTYAAGGSNTVTLTVTDNDSATGSTTRLATPVASRPITLIGSTVNQGNVATPNAFVPAGTAAGDRLIMVLSLNDITRIVGSPTSGVTGWTLVDTAVSGTMQTNVYTKIAVAGDANKTTRFSMDAAAKYTLTVAAYSGDMLAPEFIKASETVLRSGHSTPTTQAAAGDWVVSYWADKSSATTSFALPVGVTQRQAICSANAGHICSVLADSGAGVPAGTYGPLTAVADSASANATMWSIRLRQDG